jgi:hypothetical protein
MNRRCSLVALARPASVFLAACLVLVGCDATRSRMRHASTNDPPTEKKSEAEGSEVLDVKPQSKLPFFRPSRLPGGMSDESREIERDLGIK